MDAPPLRPGQAKRILQRLGESGLPPERHARAINVGTDEALEILRHEYLRPMRNRLDPAEERELYSAFKLVQATFGGGKTQFLYCLREIAWEEGFASALVGLTPQDCPFDAPTKIYRRIAEKLQLPPEGDEEPTTSVERVLRAVAEQHLERMGKERFVDWMRTEFERSEIESTAFRRAVRHFMEAVAEDDLDREELMADFLRGEEVRADELHDLRIRERLDDKNGFRFLRSLVQTLSVLQVPGLVLLFDEMDRNMSLPPKRRQAIGDNLRQMIDDCGQSTLPGVLWVYAVPPEFMTTVVTDYVALQQRLRGLSTMSANSPLQPLIDLEHLPLSPSELYLEIGLRLLQVYDRGYGTQLDTEVQRANVRLLAQDFGERTLESGARRDFVKAVVRMLMEQDRNGEAALGPNDLARLQGGGGAGTDPMAGVGELWA